MKKVILPHPKDSDKSIIKINKENIYYIMNELNLVELIPDIKWRNYLEPYLLKNNKNKLLSNIIWKDVIDKYDNFKISKEKIFTLIPEDDYPAKLFALNFIQNFNRENSYDYMIEHSGEHSIIRNYCSNYKKITEKKELITLNFQGW